MNKAPFVLRHRRNPDVLSCIANLSNDEVFTPPDFANRMLDTLEEAWAQEHGGASIWAKSDITFLDPCTKTGVFLREITKRLIKGLEPQIPDLQERVDHILTKQVFGIAITDLTAMLARRSLYCSKHANGPHSIAKNCFNTEAGNVWFERTEHTWQAGKCIYCGASESILGQSNVRENHAYPFIHTDNIKERLAALFGDNMQFDVVIGNPPYQLYDGGYGTSAAPLYQKFVEQAKAIDPLYLTMVIPSRWFAGGKGLDDFRKNMLKDKRLRSINDYLSAAEVFPGVGLKGGVCYLLWDKYHPGDCRISTTFKDWPVSEARRPLLEDGVNIFVRFNEGISILKKVIRIETGQHKKLALPKGQRLENMTSSRKPFGLTTNFNGKEIRDARDLKVYQNGGIGYIDREEIKIGAELIDGWKIFIGRAAPGTGNRDTYPHKIISNPFIGEPGSISSETYLCIGLFDTKEEAQSALSYLSCRLARFLILLHKPSQDTTKRVYTFVPKQSWDRIWTDEMLYERYQLTPDEIEFVEKIVRPMELDISSNSADS